MGKEETREEVMERIARWLADGVEKGSAQDKRIVSLCGKWRVWANDGDEEVRVGKHGQGEALVVVQKKPRV